LDFLQKQTEETKKEADHLTADDADERGFDGRKIAQKGTKSFIENKQLRSL
jgi:hypothetical protein